MFDEIMRKFITDGNFEYLDFMASMSEWMPFADTRLASVIADRGSNAVATVAG
jgi:hypothetical protein